MEEKIHNLVSDRGPWLLKNNPISKLVYTFFKKIFEV